MADRYLRANGDWNGAVWAATSGGTAGSASTPTASDDVYIASNFTVTLTADAVCNNLIHTNGTITCNNYDMTIGDPTTGTIGGFTSSGNSTRTINMGGGTWDLRLNEGGFYISGSNLTLNPQNSLLLIENYTGGDYNINFHTGGKTYNDVNIHLGVKGGSDIIEITGSPTFRSLIIQSKNSAAHTVTFEQDIVAKKFVAIGSSAANRLALECATTPINIDSEWDGTKYVGTCYGQNLAIGEVDFSYGEVGWGYVGTNSISTDGNTGWTFQDPPKISTLVDPLTTAPGSNSNWTVNGTVTQTNTGVSGGGYEFSASGHMSTSDTYDLVESSFVYQVSRVDDGLEVRFGDTNSPVYKDSYYGWHAGPDPFIEVYADNYDYYDLDSSVSFIRLSITSGVFIAEVSYDGSSFTTAFSATLDDVRLLFFRSFRLEITSVDIFSDTSDLGSINILPPQNQGAFLQFF